MKDHCVPLPGGSDFEMRPSGQANVDVVAGYIVRFDRVTWSNRDNLSTNYGDNSILLAGDKEFVVSSTRQDQVHNLLMFKLEGYDHLGEFPSAWFEVVRRDLRHNDTVCFKGKTKPHTVASVQSERDEFGKFLVAYLRGEKEGETSGPFGVAEFELLK